MLRPAARLYSVHNATIWYLRGIFLTGLSFLIGGFHCEIILLKSELRVRAVIPDKSRACNLDSVTSMHVQITRPKRLHLAGFIPVGLDNITLDARCS